MQLVSDLTVTDSPWLLCSFTSRLVSCYYNNNNLPYILYHMLCKVFMNPKTTHTDILYIFLVEYDYLTLC